MRKYRRVVTRARQSSSWRRLKTQFKFKKLIRRVGLALTVFAAVILTLGAIYVWKFFSEPFASASSTFQKSNSWDGETPFNLLWLVVADLDRPDTPTRSFSVVSLNPTQNSLTMINLPLEYRDLDKVAQEATDLLGVPIDGYVLVGEEGMIKMAELFPEARGVKDFVSLENIFKLPSIWGIARENLATSLDLPEIFHVLWYLIKVRSDRVNLVNPTAQLLDDPTGLDRKLAPYFRDEKVVAEHLKIQVLNGSGHPGLAGAAARLIKNLGGEVIRMDNFERQDLVRGYLILESSGSYTARRLAQIFNVADSRPPRTGSEARAEVTLVLGIENSR